MSPGRGDRLGEIGETFLGSQRHDDLALGVELDAEAAGVIGRPCALRRPGMPREAE